MLLQVSKHFPNSLGVDDFIARLEMVRGYHVVAFASCTELGNR